MKKILFILLMLFAGIINIAYAANAGMGIVVKFQDGSVKTDCVNAEEDMNGYDILKKSVFSILWSPESVFGQLICKINGEGTEIQGPYCEYSGKFWNFNILPYGSNEWVHSPVGHNGPGGCWNRKEASFTGHYCSVDGDVIGYKFGSGGDEPQLMSYEQVCDKLKVKNIKIYVDGKKETGAYDDGGKIKVIPGSKLELKIELENLYTDEQDVEINDIIIQGTLNGIDNGADIEDEEYLNLNADSRKEITLKFNIPQYAEKDSYELTLEIKGKNERGFAYSKAILFEVKVNREKHELLFNKILVNGNFECGSILKLSIEMENMGSSDENTQLNIKNEILGLNKQESFNLKTGNVYKKDYLIETPKNLEGIFQLMISAVYNGGNDAETQIKEIDVKCESTQAVNASIMPKSKNEMQGITSFAEPKPLQKEIALIGDNNQSFLKKYGLVIALIFGNLLLFTCIIILIIKV